MFVRFPFLSSRSFKQNKRALTNRHLSPRNSLHLLHTPRQLHRQLMHVVGRLPLHEQLRIIKPCRMIPISNREVQIGRFPVGSDCYGSEGNDGVLRTEAGDEVGELGEEIVSFGDSERGGLACLEGRKRRRGLGTET